MYNEKTMIQSKFCRVKTLATGKWPAAGRGEHGTNSERARTPDSGRALLRLLKLLGQGPIRQLKFGRPTRSEANHVGRQVLHWPHAKPNQRLRHSIHLVVMGGCGKGRTLLNEVVDPRRR